MERSLRSQRRKPLRARDNTTGTPQIKPFLMANSFVCERCGDTHKTLLDYQAALAELLQVNARLRSRLVELEASMAERESLYAKCKTLKSDLTEQLRLLRGPN